MEHPDAPPSPPLGALLGALRDEPGLVGALGRRSTVVVIPDAARAVAVAGLTELSKRRPVVVAVPAVADAERLAADLTRFLGPDAVELFPAWETLPFERVSPSIETMGRRLRVLGGSAPGIRRCRSSSPRPGRWSSAWDRTSRTWSRSSWPPVTASTCTAWSSGWCWPATGARSQVEHRGEVAVRGSIVDVFPATADHPVRIDLWGDEVDRLAEFSVRTSAPPTTSTGSPSSRPGSCCPRPRCGNGRNACSPPSPWGREQWQRLADGEVFEGMEAGLAWLAPKLPWNRRERKKLFAAYILLDRHILPYFWCAFLK